MANEQVPPEAEGQQLAELNLLYSLSKELAVTDSLNLLLESIVRHAVEIIHVSYSRILTLEPDGTFICRVAYDRREDITRMQPGRSEPARLRPLYRRVLDGDVPFILRYNDPTLNMNLKFAMHLESGQVVCLLPLRIDTERLGILLLGEDRDEHREAFTASKLRLATAIANQSASAIHRARLSDHLQNISLETVLALVKTIEARDLYTGGHSRRMTDLSEGVAHYLGCTPGEIEAIRWSSLLHDIGKIGIPDRVLLKPAPLSPDEWRMIRQHPEVGADIVLSVSNLAHVADLVRAHHERYDGSGYPYGLKGQEIPLGARILAVVDAYDAITEGRIYRVARSQADAFAELQRCAGQDFDPMVVDAFLQYIDANHNSETR